MYILLDIGGTKMRVALSRDGKQFETPILYDTPKNFDDALAVLACCLKDNLNGESIMAVAVGLPGTLDAEKKTMIYSTHLSGWVNKPIYDSLFSLMNAPVFIENDSALACLGEAVLGAGKGKEHVVYFTISTGVGGARVVNGKIDKKSSGFEPGHQILNIENLETLEGLVSGSALRDKYNKNPAMIDDEKIWEETARILAVGINNSILHWSPDVVVLGGSMVIKEVGIKIPQVVLHLQKINKVFPILPEIKKAELGDSAGIAGALVYLGAMLS